MALRFAHETWRDDAARRDDGFVKSEFGYAPLKDYKRVRESAEFVGIMGAILVGVAAYIIGLYLVWDWFGGNEMPKSATALDYLASYIWTAVGALPFPWIPALIAYYLFSEPLALICISKIRKRQGSEADRAVTEVEKNAAFTIDLESGTVTKNQLSQA